MKKLVKFRLGLCAIELAFCIALLWLEVGVVRKFQYAGVAEVVTYGGFTIIQSARLICALVREILPNGIDLVWTRTGMVLYTVSAWVQVVERVDLDRAGLGFGAALIFLFDQTVFFLNHPVPEDYLLTLQPPPEERAALKSTHEEHNTVSKPLLEENGSCVRRTVIS